MQQALDIQSLTNQSEEFSAVHIIIPVHNRREITLTCLKHLKQNGDLDRYSIVVIDDGSTDGTAEAIQSQFSTVKILYGDGNLWWTGAIKMGMEYAYEQGGEYFIWLNDDCLPEPNTLNHLVDFLSEHPNTIAGAACYLIDADIPFETGCVGRKRFAALPKKVTSVDSLSGYCVCLPRATCDVVGFPNAIYLPHYGGDDAYILQATKAGLKAVIVGDAKAILKETDFPSQSFAGYIKNINDQNLALKSIFFTKKSKYYLPGRFFHLRLKYGKLQGSFIFAVKLLIWIFQYYLIAVNGLFVGDVKTKTTST